MANTWYEGTEEEEQMSRKLTLGSKNQVVDFSQGNKKSSSKSPPRSAVPATVAKELSHLESGPSVGSKKSVNTYRDTKTIKALIARHEKLEK